MFDISCHLNRKSDKSFRVASHNRGNSCQLDLQAEDASGSKLELTLFDLPETTFFSLIGLLGDDKTIDYWAQKAARTHDEMPF